VKHPEGLAIIYEHIEPSVLFINDIGDGGAKADKFERDIRLLTKGLEELPNNDRYTFYLANSYRDYGDNEKAIETYRKRIAIGGWIQEVWQSYFQIGRCYKAMGKMSEAICAWMDAYHAYPNRIENLYEIIQHYRVAGKNTLAYHFWLLAEESRQKYPNRDHLFTSTEVYEFKMDYELSIIGYYCNKQNHDLAKACMTTIAHKAVSDGTFKNVMSNYKFYSPYISQYGLPMNQTNLQMLKDIGRETMLPYLDEFVSSTPSLCWDDKNGNLVVCVRYVDYKIGEKGEYINKDKITTRNFIAKFDNVSTDPHIFWKKLDEFELNYDKQYNGRYVGLEDVRLFSYNKENGAGEGRGRLIYNANRGLEGDTVGQIPSTHENCRMAVEHGWIVGENTVNSKLLTYEKQCHTEKNWCLFGGIEEVNLYSKIKLKCVYSWNPLVIGTVCPNMGKFTETHRNKNMPRFFKDVRCSTNGVTIGDEIWFIAHIVSYEDRRYYYHIMIVLDSETYELKRYSKLWRFEKDQKVEYTLGFVHFSDTNRFLIGYSVMDRETKYVLLPRHIFDELWV
jgi:tetratricopeptide (TPR) repeat protein